MKGLICSLVVLCSLPLFAQGKDPVANAIRTVGQRFSKNITAAMEEMPADKYGFKATPEQMSFGHLAVHITEGNNFMCSKIGGAAAPKTAEIKETDPKDKLVSALKDSFEFCGTVLGKLNDSNLGEMLALWGGQQQSRAATLFILSNSWADHYSLAATYLRLNHLLPPTAKGKAKQD
jgi:hypothetical protein